MARARILVLNQYYTPGFESTGQLLARLCEELARTWDVTVVTGVSDATHLGRESQNDVEVVRVASTRFDRRRLVPRGANYISYVLASLTEAVRGPRPDLVLCMSDPPFLGTVGYAVARRFGVPCVVIVQDVFPEIAVELRRLHNPLLVRALDLLVRIGLRRADRVVVIGETMRRRLIEKGVRSAGIEVIPNWVDANELQPAPKDNPWSRKHELADAFVVMHSGNVGYSQDLDLLVRASTFLRDLDRLRFVVIGAGARQADLVALHDRLDADRFLFLPYQPREVLPLSLSAADVHFVGLGRGLAGYVVPSRINGVLSVGRPAIVAADSDSEIALLVEEGGCGIAIPPGRADLLAGAIRDAYEGRYDLAELGRRGREYALANLDESILIGRYKRLIEELLA